MNGIFLGIVLLAFAVAGYRQATFVPSTSGETAPMQALAAEVVNSAGGAVTLAIELIGVMTLFLGLMKVAEAGGLLVIIARLVRPLMQRLFPDVPANHSAMGAMILNISANVLGLGNAATPFGIRAMQELDALNPLKGTATNAMVLFLAINTASVTLPPTGVIALRAAAGSTDPAGIMPTTLLATICSTAVAIVMAKVCQRYWPMTDSAETVPTTADRGPSSVALMDSDPTAEIGSEAIVATDHHFVRTRDRALDHSGFGGCLACVRSGKANPCLRGAGGRRSRRLPGCGANHSLFGGHPGRDRHAARERRVGGCGHTAGTDDTDGWRCRPRLCSWLC